jgi:hypothetical protein
MTYRGFWRELFSRSNKYVSTMAVISIFISAPIVVLSCAALIYDIFWLGHGLKDPSVKLLIALIGASTGGLAASQFSKRTYTEMTAGMPSGSILPRGGEIPQKVKPPPGE